jgi:FkbM family methyltransferase
MSIPAAIRAFVPAHWRAKLRRSQTVNRVLRWRYGGDQSQPHPCAPLTFHFDGYRNIGWSMGGLAECETHELEYCGNLIRQRNFGCVWDIGANVGLWSLYLSSLTPPVSQVICFEPDPGNVRYLEKNRQINQLYDRMVVRQLALSSEPGTATFYSDQMTGKTGSLEQGSDFLGRVYGATRQAVQVEVSTVDREVASGTPPPGFIKIDVEGHELNLLKGARETLSLHRPLIMIEVSQNVDEVGRLLTELGYQLFDAMTFQPVDRPAYNTVAIHSSDRMPLTPPAISSSKSTTN